MKTHFNQIFILVVTLLFSTTIYSQNPSAIMDLESTDKGFLIPRTDTSSVNNNFTPATGLMIYQTTDNLFYFYNGTKWIAVATPDNDQDPQNELIDSAVLVGDTLKITEANVTYMIALDVIKDNLGNHIATENIQLNDQFISYDGDDQGLKINDKGGVSIGKSTSSNRFEVFADSSFVNELCDQSANGTGMPLAISSTTSGAQTFVVDTSGTLSRIEILAKDLNSNNDTIQIEVKTGSNPATGSSLAISTTIIDYSVDSTYSVIFNPGIPVNKNDSLIIIMTQLGGDNLEWQRSSTDLYNDGEAWIDASGWIEINALDHWFKNYIEVPDTSEVPIITLKDDLRVGIGIHNPQEKLQVNGAITIASSINIDPPAGTIRWNENTQDFEGFTGTSWKSLTSQKDDKFWGNTDISYSSTECNKVLASDGDVFDYFGYSVAISGDYAIIGAHLNDDDGADSGSAYIFQRSGNNWTEQTKLIASDTDAGDNFGISVSISGDYAIVGANKNDNGGVQGGSAYIFHRSGNNWTEQTKLTASDAEAFDFFGNSVAISEDCAIIGAMLENNGSGSAYIFQKSGNNWTEQTKLTASDAAPFDNFGKSLSISGDYAIIGAHKNDDGGTDSGSAYIFKRSGNNWTEQTKLTASDAEAGDIFGESVSISGDYAVIGARGNDDVGFNTGSAYIFKRSGNNWTEQTKLTASDTDAGDSFGCSVAISEEFAIIGAFGNYNEGIGSGSAYVFQRSGNNWTQQAKLRASDRSSSDTFGYSVSISGGYVVVGAYLDDDNGNNSGSVYIFN